MTQLLIPSINRQALLSKRPVGFAQESDWSLTETPVALPENGEILVRVTHLSLDPAMRGWMNAAKSYIEPVALGAVMRAFGLGEVVASGSDSVPVGSLVTGEFGVQEHALMNASDVEVVERDVAVPPGALLGLLGLTGMTAYFGLLDIAEFKPGQTVLVSGAAGAVGSTVGQIAKALGGRVVGIAGGAEKCAYLTETLGFDAAIDYKSGDVGAAIRAALPNGADVFFDNVGGEILDHALANLAMKARVIICGAVSQYNNTEAGAGPKNYRALLVKRARMEGMVVFDYVERFPEATKQLTEWLGSGQIVSVEDVVRGSIADFPATLMRLFEGKNTGKLVLEIV